MKVPTRFANGRAGLSMLELLVLLVMMALLAMILLPYLARSKDGRGQAEVRCANNLKNVSIAFQIFAVDNNDRFPHQLMASNGWHAADAVGVFRWLSNELSTPLLLHCRLDTNRVAESRANFNTMSATNVSYFVSLTAAQTNPTALLAGDRNLMTNGKAVGAGLFAMTTNMQGGWTREMHMERGNVVLADGSVQRMNSSAELKAAVKKQGIATNFLSIP